MTYQLKFYLGELFFFIYSNEFIIYCSDLERGGGAWARIMLR